MNDDKPPSTQSLTIFQKCLNLFSKKNSKADLREYLQEAQDNNIIDSEEANMITGVLAVSEQKVRDIMIPKSQMTTIPYDLGFSETLDLVIDSGHSRFPVEKDDNIIGILLAKDLLSHVQHIFLKKENEQSFDIQSIMRSVQLVPEAKPVDILLREFRHKKIHMVVITNEYGDISGVVTIEDVLEEIVGDIDDEHDIDDEENIKILDSTSHLVSAITTVEDFNEAFNSTLSDEDYDTIGGHVLSSFGYVPVIGEKISFSTFDFIVKEASERKIISLVVKNIPGKTSALNE